MRCRNRAATKSLICSISFYSTLSSSFIQRFRLRLLPLVIYISIFLLLLLFLLTCALGFPVAKNSPFNNTFLRLTPSLLMNENQSTSERQAVPFTSRVGFVLLLRVRPVVSSCIWQHGLPLFLQQKGEAKKKEKEKGKEGPDGCNAAAKLARCCSQNKSLQYQSKIER